MKVCPNCKIEYEDTKNFCIHCGAELVKESGYDELLETLSEAINEIKKNKDNINSLRREIEKVFNKKPVDGNELATLEERIFNKIKKDVLRKIELIKSDIEKTKNDIYSLNIKKERLDKDIGEIFQKTRELLSEYRKETSKIQIEIKKELTEKIDANTESISKLAEKLKSLNINGDTGEIKKVINIIRREIKNNREMLLKTIKDEIIEQWDKKLKTLDKKVNDLEKLKKKIEKLNLEKRVKGEEREIDVVEKQIQKIREEFRKFQIQRSMALNEKINLNVHSIERLSDRIREIEEKIENYDNVIKKNVKGILKEIKQDEHLIKEINNIRKHLSEHDSNVKVLFQEISNLKKEIKYMEDRIVEKIQAQIARVLVG